MSLPAATLAVLLLAALAAPVTVAEPASNPECTPGVKAYCARARSDVRLSCSIRDGNFTCRLGAVAKAVAASRTSLPGQLVSPEDIEVGICNGEGACNQTWQSASSTCEWEVRGRSCKLSSTWRETVSGPLEGCLYVWVYHQVGARARVPDVAHNVASQTVTGFRDFDSCHTS